MTFKPLACALIATSFLTACSTGPVKQKVNNEPVVFTEPEISPPFYALNPFDYNAPPPFEVALKAAAAQPVTKLQVTDPSTGQTTTLETNRLIVPIINSNQRAMKFAVLAGENEIDITEIDDFLQLVKVRHAIIHHALPNVRNVVVLKINLKRLVNDSIHWQLIQMRHSMY